MTDDREHAPTPSFLSATGARRLAERFRAVDFTADGIAGSLGPAAYAALSAGDLCAAERATRTGDPLATLVRLFVLGMDVPARSFRRALSPVAASDALDTGLAESAGLDTIRARIDIRPYAEEDGAIGPGGVVGPAGHGPTETNWWVVSDFAAEFRPLRPDHVLGVGAASTTLAQAVVRSPVARALDVGTGSGVQALHLSRHAGSVVVTDVSRRALAMAAATAALNGMEWDLRLGDLLEPVDGERFDLIVANPPFVVGPGDRTFDYRDSGRAGDGVSAELLRGLPNHLTDAGTAQMLANWAITADQTWTERVSDWVEGTGCDAWIWQREVADPGEYVRLWLRDGGLVPGTAPYRAEYDRWADWFEANGVLAVGMGLVNLRRSPHADPIVVCEDVPQPLEQPAAPAIGQWWVRADWLAGHSDTQLLATHVSAAPDLVRTDHAVPTSDRGWSVELIRLRNGGGMHWEVDADESIAALVSGCATGADVGTVVDLLAGSLGHPPEQVRAAVVPVLRDLIARGLLIPGNVHEVDLDRDLWKT